VDQEKCTQDQARKRELAFLKWIGRFGFLHANDLARLETRSCEESIRLAQRRLKRLTERHEIIMRALPFAHDQWNRVYVLAAPGADRLRSELGVRAISGKDIELGASALHDRLANQAAIEFIARGYEVVTLRELHQQAQSRSKIPDFLVRARGNQVPAEDLDGWFLDLELRDGHYMWWEVERARRTGAPRRIQAAWLTEAAAKGFRWNDFDVSGGGVVYPTPCVVDHRARTSAALAEMAPALTNVTFLRAEVNQTTFSAKDWQLSRIQVEPLKLKSVLAALRNAELDALCSEVIASGEARRVVIMVHGRAIELSLTFRDGIARAKAFDDEGGVRVGVWEDVLMVDADFESVAAYAILGVVRPEARRAAERVSIGSA
jgi:hypothetical protein